MRFFYTKRQQRKDKQANDEQFHLYVKDIGDLHEQRELVTMRMVLGRHDKVGINSLASQEEVARYDVMIEMAQRAIIEIKGKHDSD